jgi:hypothetical protein
MADAFPLQWPEGWQRTPAWKRRSAPYKVSPDKAQRELFRSLHLLGAASNSVILSTNVQLRQDGLPYAKRSVPQDPGVAVYWFNRTHGERVIACDCWLEVYGNIRAIGLAVEGLRAIERAGASQILERAFTAFGALPPSPDAKPVRPWWEVLEFPEPSVQYLTLELIEARYRKLAKECHPDRGSRATDGGQGAAMIELNDAIEQARKQLRGG